MERFRAYIDGTFTDGEARFESLDPATGRAWAEMPEARESDVDRAVAAAERALYDGPWATMNATARGKLLSRLADLVAANAGRLAELETRDTGKIIRETSAQIAYVAEYYRYYAGLADKIEGSVLPIDKPDMDVWLRREPIGVVAAIVPWNSQLFLAAVKIGPALAAGCTLVVKASEDGPAPLLAFAELVHEAGFPNGVVNILTGFGATCGSALARHPKVAHVAFTGGPETARAIVRHSAENLASTSLELGGKSPFIVFADADLESAANAQVAGIFAATGQSCVAGSRLLVERSVKERFLAILKAKAEAVRIGTPLAMETEVGPLCTARQRGRIEALIAASVERGATVVTGGTALAQDGFFFPPTILDCDGTDAPALREEFFGPVLSVVSFADEAEALRLANDSLYGLAAGLFTKDLTRAHRMMKRLRTGIVWVNTYRAVSPIAPFGGTKLSGHGREGGLAAALDFTRTKTIWLRTSDDPIPDPFVMR
ncbi:aldehyde dehydrogenase [Segnochrobactrum spirostomi]|uniref:Aldehyde dehydrogenase n=1 Tax=Segnochrobactrum spirostomi TaxID=2608987 RepID=A0A6A7Y620_9HYPH|nr:aldehyde dehydrogenase [Segnochrobactrum spirostomi]MQT14674.1 aldehyde dehydrogenase [Segnochrobactrum spirostomi]